MVNFVVALFLLVVAACIYVLILERESKPHARWAVVIPTLWVLTIALIGLVYMTVAVTKREQNSIKVMFRQSREELEDSQDEIEKFQHDMNETVDQIMEEADKYARTSGWDETPPDWEDGGD